MNESINQQVNDWMNEWMNEWINQSIDRSIDQPTNQPTNERTNKKSISIFFHVIVGYRFDDWIYWTSPIIVTVNYDSLQSMTVYDSLYSLLDHEHHRLHCDEWQTKISCPHLELPWRTFVSQLNCQSQSQSYIATDGQSVSKSWCQAPSGAHDQIFITVWQLWSCSREDGSLLLRGCWNVYTESLPSNDHIRFCYYSGFRQCLPSHCLETAHMSQYIQYIYIYIYIYIMWLY
jgi:hypothetical protein